MKWAQAFGYPHTSPEATELARRYAMNIAITYATRREEWELRAHIRVLRIVKAIERYSAARASAAMAAVRARNEAARSAAPR